MTRREFLEGAAASGLVAGCSSVPTPGFVPAAFTWGALFHLGANMWGDCGPNGEHRSDYADYLRCDDALWRQSVDRAAAKGLNLVFIDLGEGVAYPSHPELAVKGTWSVAKLRAELHRMRTLGLEPVPKLNFSTAHDSWLKEYGRMVSSRRYYEVVADLIRDVCEIFDSPRLFHIGYDEEMPIAQEKYYQMVCRQRELWWHDLFFTVNEVSHHGARPVMWADAIWTGRAEYLKRMSKDVLQANWYYRTDFSPAKLKWDYDFEKKGGWGETVNGAAAFLALEEAGFDQLPFTSNWAADGSADAVVAFCKEHIDPSRLKGFCTASWKITQPDTPERKRISATLSAVDLLAAARVKHYGF